jgi:hypothetical protein
MAHWLGLNLLVLGYVFPTKEMRGEKERESTGEQMVIPPLPQALRLYL